MSPTPQRVGVWLASDEWAIVLEALRRFAPEHEVVGRPDVAKVAHRALSTLVTHRVAAGVEALDDVDLIEKLRLTHATADRAVPGTTLRAA
jgi:hypothetical protein